MMVATAVRMRRKHEPLPALAPGRRNTLTVLAALCERYTQPFTTAAWDRIEAASSQVLDLYVGLMLMPEPPLELLLIRRAIVENPALSDLATALAGSETQLARIEAMIQAAKRSI